MGAVQPESKPAPEAALAGDAVANARHEEPATAVNSAARPTSNSKEIRAREAEEDRALIAKAQAGDTAAFRSLVERHQRRAFAIAYSLVRDEHDARELVQDAFLRVFKGLGTFQNNSSFFTWLYRIVTNLSIDLMRKPGRGGAGGITGDVDGNGERAADNDSDSVDFPLLSRIDGSDPADVLRRREIGARLQLALDALPPYHRSVIVMREVEGLSYDDMAHVMGVSKGTIMSRLFHARQKLQRALHDCYVEQVGAREAPSATKNNGATEADAHHDDEPPQASGGDEP
jgi:RNA polymerase sigma-70 factor (ECF subfamily)